MGTILSICLFYLPDLLSSLKSSLNQSSSTHLTSPPSPHSLSQQPANMSRASTSRTLAKAVKATEQSEGVGATVRRSIGTPALRNLSPFLMLDHFKVGKGAGFSEHPHRGQATITYMLSGAFRHEDHKGHKGTLNPGDVQWMQAGKGIVHSEMPLHEEGKGDPTGMQLWVDLPRAQKMSPPDYQELASSEMPYAHPSEGVTIKVISGVAQGNEKEGEISSPVKPHGGCWYFDISLDAGASVFQAIPAGWTTFAYILEGTVQFGSGSDAVAKPQYNTCIFSSEPDQNGVALQAVDGPARLVLVAGEPLDQPVVQMGPFVMNSREEIQQAVTDFQMGRNGFEGVHEWRSESAAALK